MKGILNPGFCQLAIEKILISIIFTLHTYNKYHPRYTVLKFLGSEKRDTYSSLY